MRAMKKLIFYLLPIFAVSMLSSIAFSQKVGSTSMQFLKVMPCARATAMGDAYSVLASGAEAVFWNPGGLASLEGQEISVTYLKWIFDTQQGALAFASSLGGWGVIGIQLQYVDFGEIPEAIWGPPYNNDLNYPGLTGNTFRPFSCVGGITYASRITDKFSTGFAVKYAYESLYNGNTARAVTKAGDTVDVNTWANGVLFDFGLHYKTNFHSIEIGASVQNFGPSLKYAIDANPAPLALRVGIAADIIGRDALLGSSEDSRLGLAFDLFQPNDYEQQYHAGMEYEFSQMVALRVGYKFNYDADGFTAGMGVKQTVGAVRLSVDYSYGALSYNLGNVHRISLGVGF
jgi:hypothetical protein